MAKKKTQAELQREENEALGGFIQVDTLPGNVIDCTPRSVKKRAARVMKALAAREAREAQKEKIRRQHGAFSYALNKAFKRFTGASACA